jgi:predicted HTH transcriptional regulator
MIVCNSCYSKNEDKVKLCNYCGASLSKKHESPKSTNTTEKKTTYQLNNITEHEIDSLSTNLSNQTDTVTCLGYYSNKGICTTSTSPLSTISINSYWRSFSIPNNTHIIFDYEPIKKVAYNIRIYPAPVNQTKKNKLEVKGGTVPTGDYYLTNKGLILRGETESVCLYGAKISLITEERAKHLITSVALGVVGTLATFGVGLVVGA